MVEVHESGFDGLPPRTAYALWALRESVFVVEQACAYQELDGRDLEPGTVHLWVEDGGVPVACLRLLEEPDGRVRVGRVATAAPYRGAGLAGRLVDRALDIIGGRPSRLDAQSHLVRFYARFGYAEAGPEFLEDGIPHVPMERG